MKIYFLILILFISNSVQSQTSWFSQNSESQLDYYKSHLSELKDESGNKVLNDTTEIELINMTGEIGHGFGCSVSTAGDVNGDGYADIIIGSEAYNFSTGRAYIFYGGANMNNVADVTMTGESSSSHFGFSVSTAGDVNGDGYSDVIVGAYNYPDINYTGKAFIFYGGVMMNNIPDVIMIGGIFDRFGASVSNAGDVNDDGYSDVIVGAFYGNNQTGNAYIYHGGVMMNNIPDVIMQGEDLSNLFGYSVSTAGDVNSDGYSDVIVGAYDYYHNATFRPGRTYIYFGGAGMNNVPDVIMEGEAHLDCFGFSVSTAGDINSDGYSDVIVGAYRNSGGAGKAYIYHGGVIMNNIPDVIMKGEVNDSFGRSVSTAGDINGDGYSDVIVRAYNYVNLIGLSYIFHGGGGMNNVADVIMTEVCNNQFGKTVSSAGDINADGYSDVIVGTEYNNPPIGKTYLYINLKQKPELIGPANYSIHNSTTINFRWRRLKTALYYVLNVSTDSVFNNIIVNDTIFIDTSRTVSRFQQDTKYFWRVRPKDIWEVTNTSLTWNFTTIPYIKINLTVIIEGMYDFLFNQLSRKDSFAVYLRDVISPYVIRDSSKGLIDSLTFSGLFLFPNAQSGIYYLVVKHLNGIETWSKAGGESLETISSIYNYDFTTSNSQAFGNNLKLKGIKWTIFSGDVNQDGIVDASDLSAVDNDAYNSVSGYDNTDVNGDNFVDAGDISIVDNNVFNSVMKITP